MDKFTKRFYRWHYKNRMRRTKRYPKFYQPLPYDILIQVCLTFKELIGHIELIGIHSNGAVSIRIYIPEYYSVDKEHLVWFFEQGWQIYKEGQECLLEWEAQSVIAHHQPKTIFEGTFLDSNVAYVVRKWQHTKFKKKAA